MRDWLASRMPWLGPVKRRWQARLDTLGPVRTSYAQHGEDVFLAGLLSGYDLSRGLYVDVGANHPTSISNTYLFYRRGLRGVTVEPNRELIGLHRRYRPRDIGVGVGCGAQARLAVFEISKTPVLSRFSIATVGTAAHGGEMLRREYVPILTLDTIMASIPGEWVYLLSVDVEGLDQAVLEGAPELLKKTLLICIEAEDDRSRAELKEFLGPRGFGLVRTLECNAIFRNTDARFDLYRATRPS